jgi:hypothetical protein
MTRDNVDEDGDAPASTASGMIQRPFYYDTLGVDPTNGHRLPAPSFYKSTDGGKTFVTMRTPPATTTTSGSARRTVTMISQRRRRQRLMRRRPHVVVDQNQPTGEFYGVDRRTVPYKLYRAAGRQHHHSLVAEPYQPTGARAPAARQADHAASEESRDRLRLVQGAVRRAGPEDRTGKELLDRRAVALWQPERSSSASSASRRWRRRRTIPTSLLRR